MSNEEELREEIDGTGQPIKVKPMPTRYASEELTPEQTTTLANITPGSKLQVRQGMSIADCPTSLDLKTRRGKSLALAAMSPGTLEFDGDGQVKILATDFLLFPDQGTDPETGEVHEFTRTVFFDKEGHTYRTTAAHGPRRLQAILQLFSPDEWKAGIPITVVLRRSPKTGRTYHDIRVDIDGTDE